MATDKLCAAIRTMPVVSRPASTLGLAWPDVGTYWLTQWVGAVERDLRLAGDEMASAAAAGATEDGRVAVEHAYWRLASVRDRLATLTALVTGVPTIEIRKRKQIVFRRQANEHERRLKNRLHDLAIQGYGSASRLVQLNGDSGAKLLIRHQQSHSLAPILGADSLVWIEVGHIKSPGGIYGYTAHHLLAKGALDEQDLSPAVLFERAVRLLNEAYATLDLMVDTLAQLITDAALPLPVPEVVWRVHETGDHFLSRDDAINASEVAAVSPLPVMPTP